MIPKFRAWHNREKRWIDVLRMDFIGDLVFIVNKENNAVYKRPCNEGGCIDLLQSTGLFDKNGIEIFEGDIVDSGMTAGSPNTASKNRRKIAGVIFFENGSFLFGNPRSKYYKWNLTLCTLEIIGNTFDNPELMEE